MIINYKFTSYDGQEIEGMRTEFDRNYDDEETAIFFVEDEHHADTEGYFEVNIRKDKDGRLMQEGYVAEYENSNQAEAAHLTDLQVTVIEHDFDETLRKANEKLRPFGKRIVVDYDGECYFAISSTDLDGSNPDYYVDADFEHEVNADIWECLVHVLARVNDPGLAKPVAVPMEKFKVTVIFGEYAARAYGNGGVKEMIEHMDEGQLMVREFDTEAERRAYIMGVDDSDGWLGAAVLSDKDAKSAIVKELLDE